MGINLVLRASYQSNKSATMAFWVFMLFYVLAAVVTWWFYARRPIVIAETTDLAVTGAHDETAPTVDGTASTGAAAEGTDKQATKEALA